MDDNFRRKRAAVVAAFRQLSPLIAIGDRSGRSAREWFKAALREEHRDQLIGWIDTFASSDPSEGPELGGELTPYMLMLEAIASKDNILLQTNAHEQVASAIVEQFHMRGVIEYSDMAPIHQLILDVLKRLGKVALKAALIAVLVEILKWLQTKAPVSKYFESGRDQSVSGGTPSLPTDVPIQDPVDAMNQPKPPSPARVRPWWDIFSPDPDEERKKEQQLREQEERMKKGLFRLE